MNYDFPSVGAFLKNSTCRFSVWAPGKTSIELVLDLDGSAHRLEQDQYGYWSLSMDGITPDTKYKFRVDKMGDFPDPASRFQPHGVHGPSQVFGEDFIWNDKQWRGIALKDMIIYELHVGTFTREGTFEGIINKLSYLKELGVNTIELMPVAQFPGERNWGYDGVCPFAVQNSYGGPAELKSLVNKAHENGIAVLIDVVYNHVGPEGNYLSQFGPYFTDKYKTFWGKAINYDDAYCDGVRNYFWQNALMWLDEFHIDGLRLDAVHAIWDFSARHFVEELVTKVSDLKSRTGKEKVLIAEFDLNNPRYITPPEKGGYGMDGQWIDEFHHALHSIMTGEVNGYYEDFGSIEKMVKAFQHSYVYTGEYSQHRKKYFGRLPTDCSYGQFVVFSQNHDQVGNRMLGDRLTTQLDFESLKLTAASVLLAAQVPMLFMGEEYAEKNPFLYFINHSDKELIEMVRKGRREEFSYFNWKGEVPDPQGEKTFQSSKLSWGDRDKQQARLFAFYKNLISFRKSRIACKGQTQETLNVFHDGNSRVIGIRRAYLEDEILVVLNFDDAVAPFVLPSDVGCTRKIFDSSSLEWNGNGELTKNEAGPREQILLNPKSVVIFE